MVSDCEPDDLVQNKLIQYLIILFWDFGIRVGVKFTELEMRFRSEMKFSRTSLYKTLYVVRLIFLLAVVFFTYELFELDSSGLFILGDKGTQYLIKTILSAAQSGARIGRLAACQELRQFYSGNSHQGLACDDGRQLFLCPTLRPWRSFRQDNKSCFGCCV